MFKYIQNLLGLTSEEQAKRTVYNIICYIGIIYCYTTLRVAKDAVSVSVGKGAGILSFLKTYVTLPLTFVAWILYNHLSNNFKRTTVFRIVMPSFIAFFTLYAFVLGPNRELLNISPENAKGTIAFLTKLDLGVLKIGSLLANIYKNVICQWTVALFYAACELWGTLCISQLFWGFIISTSSRVEASKTFQIYQFVSSLGSIITLILIKILVEDGTTAAVWNANLQRMTLSMIVAATICLYFHYLSSKIAALDTNIGPEKAPLKKKITLIQSLKVVTKSPTLIYLTVITATYGTAMALIETVVKNLVGKVSNFSETGNLTLAAENIGLQGAVQMVVGLVAIGWMANASWKNIAIVTPIVFTFAGFIFFGALFSPAFAALLLSAMNSVNLTFRLGPALTATIQALAYTGLIQTLAIKTAKYSFLDVARERSYIPLSEEEKTLGKNSVDILGSRLGKGSGGLLISTLFIPLFGGDVNLPSWQQIDNIVPHIAFVYALCIGLMLFSILQLIPIYEAKDQEQSDVEARAHANAFNAASVTSAVESPKTELADARDSLEEDGRDNSPTFMAQPTTSVSEERS